MTLEEFDKVAASLNDLADQIVVKKRPDYTQQDTDVLANFKRAAHDAGITPLQAWLVHFQKQYSAVARYVANPTCEPSESITSRFADLRNYLQLGFALYNEK
jgi:hypothetical protein